MTAEVDLKNPKLSLIPGMYAEVRLNLADAANAVAVPIGAVDGSGNQSKAFVVDSTGVVHERTVTTGIQNPQFIQIMSGIEPGDTVILGNHSGIQAGAKVQPRFE
jgi:multidrug efflux pump subunit AcrA (membrane-fusion protein)